MKHRIWALKILLIVAFIGAIFWQYSKQDLNKTSWNYIGDILALDNSYYPGSEKHLDPEYYKIFKEIKSPSGSKVAVLFGLDMEKTNRCCSEPIGLFVIDNGKVDKYKILKGALEHLYITNVVWVDDNKLSFDKVTTDEGGAHSVKSYLNLLEDNSNPNQVPTSLLRNLLR